MATDPALPIVYSCSGRPILALDGCHLACVRNSLAQRDVAPDAHLILGKLGVRKRYREDFDPGQAERVFDEARAALVRLGCPSETG